jgi:diketogulonate reductase-like aldo/keto reductase
LAHDGRTNKAGTLKAIGISNSYPDRSVVFVLRNEVVPAANQIEINHFHPRLDAQNLLEKYNIQTEGWAPFAEDQNGIFQNENAMLHRSGIWKICSSGNRSLAHPKENRY